MAISHSSTTPSNGAAFAFAASAAAAAAADTSDPPPKRQRRPSVRLTDTVALLAADARPRRIKQRSKLSPPPADPRRPKFLSLTDNTLDSFDENRDTLASIKRGIKAEKLRAKNWSFSGDADSDSHSDWEGGNMPGGHGGVMSWLDGMGLGRYGPVFDMHGVDGEVLPLLTMEDLREMGITAVGTRRKMYGGIQKLRAKIKKAGVEVGGSSTDVF